MISFFETSSQTVIAVSSKLKFNQHTLEKLCWLFGDAHFLDAPLIKGIFVGPRKEMITPWSTNAVEITQNMGIQGIERIEEFYISENENPSHDPMLQVVYKNLDEDIFKIDTE